MRTWYPYPLQRQVTTETKKREADLREKRHDFLVIHGSEDSSLRNFKTVDVKDGQDGTRFGRVDVLERMPRRSCWTGFCFTVSDDTGHDKVRIIHYGSKGNTEGVSKFSTLVYTSWGFRVDVTRKALQKKLGSTNF